MNGAFIVGRLLRDAQSKIAFGDLQDAVEILKNALLIDQDSIETLHLLGLVLANLARFSESREVFLRVLSINPDISEAYYNLGRIDELSEDYKSAIKFYQKAVDLAPKFLEALSSLGVLLNKHHRFADALHFHKRVIKLSPNMADGWAHAGISYVGIQKYDLAVSFFDRALELDPDFPFLSGYRLYTKMRICAWDDFRASSEDIVKKALLGKKVSEPFAFLAISDSLDAQKICAKVWCESMFFRQTKTAGHLTKRAKKKLRVGYFSPDFRDHAVSFLTAELFELHNRDKFEVVAFSLLKSEPVGMRKRLLAAFDKFIDIDDMSDFEVAELSRNMEIDIAVDLGGYTENCRTSIFAYRAAPIQISYLGYLGTMGSNFIDYLIADKFTVQQDSEKYYCEKIIYLPSYQVNDRLRKVSEQEIGRFGFGLPEDKFIFCCFNSSFKILPEVFDSWLRILMAVDNSVLYLQADNEFVKNNLIAYALKGGISHDRLIFGERLKPAEYLARYRCVDLFLDTFPYNAGTTASDALWVGLPVLTRSGKSFCSRVAGSLLKALDLLELITYSQPQYEEMAIRLATNPDLLKNIKGRLNRSKMNSRLFDTPTFVSTLEKAYELAQHRHCAGLEKTHLEIAPD